MTLALFQMLLLLLTILGSVFLMLCVYFVIVAFFGLPKQKPLPKTEPKTRFAVLVAARNEEAVIGQLVESLKAQDYPDTLYDIIVAPNNCTDNTRQVAIDAGAQIFDPVGVIRSKGEVLKQLCDSVLKQGKYDAICVFDADNLAKPDFLQVMNDAAGAGMHAVQGYRDSKNPADSVISTCSSVSYWIVNRFYNGGREKLGLSSLIHGCGFMVSTALLEKLGGFVTCSMTEDYEFTAQCVLAGEKVHYLPNAQFYDEQPLTFRQSWKQRMRWGVGYIQVARAYLGPLFSRAIKNKDGVSLDLTLTVAFPLLQPFSLLLGAASLALAVYGVLEMHVIPVAVAVVSAIAGPLLAFLAVTLLAAFVVRISRGKLPGAFGGVVMFCLFQLTWLPISILSLFKKNIRWEAVGHTRAVGIQQMKEKTK